MALNFFSSCCHFFALAKKASALGLALFVVMASYFSFHSGRFSVSYFLSRACRWKEDADGAAWGSQRPRRHGKTTNDERGDDVKGVCAVTAGRGAGEDCACQVEKDAGIGPFLEPRKARHEDGNGPKHLPDAQDGEEVHWVAKD